jgi:hypothetical protein
MTIRAAQSQAGGADFKAPVMRPHRWNVRVGVAAE